MSDRKMSTKNTVLNTVIAWTMRSGGTQWDTSYMRYDYVQWDSPLRTVGVQ